MNNDIIADKIEEAIGQMFSDFSSQEFGPTEYSIFYNPQKQTSWFIVIYFSDNNTLKTAIKQGICYQIHTFLLNEINKVPNIAKIDKSISFEFGNRPSEKVDIENMLEQLIAKMNSLLKEVSKSNIIICSNCGHDFDKHQLMCNLIDDKATPTDGWIMCPEEDCNCFQTWGTNYDIETVKSKNKLGGLFKNLFKKK